MASTGLSEMPKESLKKFVFSMKNEECADDEKFEIVIPEVSQKNIYLQC